VHEVIAMLDGPVPRWMLGTRAELVQALLTFRFGVELPIWLALGFLAWRRATLLTLDLWLALGVSAIAAWMPVHYLSTGHTLTTYILTGNMLTLIIVAAIILPIRFRATLVLAFTQVIVGPALTAWLGAGLVRVPVSAALLDNTLFGLVIAFAGFLRDRADRRQFAQHEHVTALNAELARLNAERAEFMAIAAHDVRAPLGAVQLTAQLARAEPAATGALREMLDEIAAAAARMAEIVGSFLNSHAAESGALPVRLAPLDLGAAADEAVRRHAAAATQKKQLLQRDRAPTPEPPASAPAARDAARVSASTLAVADAALLAQVLDNFLSNAIKFTPAGGAIRVAVLAGDSADTLRLAVRDNGPGLTAEDRARAFGKFARLTARPTAGEASTGLGLAVTRRLASAMGGTVGVAEADGGGAEFWIDLPVAK
jgi:signal transduction histidine kinase